MTKLYNCLLLFFLLFGTFFYSQSEAELQKIQQNTNTSYLRKFSLTEKKKFEDNLNRAYVLAERFRWKKIIETDSTYSRLVGVTEDSKPIYYMTENRGAGITSRTNQLYSGGSLGISVEGQGMLAGVWDAGSPLLTHELFSGRISLQDNSPYLHPHASHVSGTIIGTDNVQNGTARGMAFKGNSDNYDWDNDVSEVAAAAAAGLLISNHSYGYNPFGVSLERFGKYDQDSRDFDEISFNAPYYQMVCAAGNSRIYGVNTGKNGFDLITGHALSKNVITVAAVEEVLNYTGPSSVVMSEFSSWGPSDDGRIKPDISTKGVHTFSAVDGSNSSYEFYDGTSMASPTVAGTLLLLQQYYHQLYNSYMKASTLKGLMIHSADETGIAPGPDYKFGWGLINAEKAGGMIRDKNLFSLLNEEQLAEGETKNFTVNSDGTHPLILTLTWTDPVGNLPSNTLDDPTPNIVNDLDIEVTKNGVTYYPWKLTASNVNAPATKGINNVDNVEKIEIENASGSYAVRIKHKGNLANSVQNYSLIASGILTTDFWFDTSTPTQKVCKENTEEITFDFQFHKIPAFSGTVNLTADNLPAGVTAIFEPQQINSQETFKIKFTNISSLNPGSYLVTIRGQEGTQTFDYPITIVVYSSQLVQSSLLLPANNNPSVNFVDVEFSWNNDVNSDSYILEIANNSNFTNAEIIPTTINNYKKNLSSSTVYYWRVKSLNTCGESIYSEIRSFTTTCPTSNSFAITARDAHSITVSWNDTSGTNQWEIEIVPSGSTPIGSGQIINSNPYKIENLLSNTCYDIYVRSVCNISNSVWVKIENACTDADYCGGEHFYDSGGANGDYQPNESLVKTIYPDGDGKRVKAIFQDFEISYYAYFAVYDGPNTSSPYLFSGNTMNIPTTFKSTHSSGALTFYFYSYNTNTERGWDAQIICEDKPACPNPPSNVILSSATKTSVTVSWQDFTNATQWEVEFVPGGTLPTGTGIIVDQKFHQFSDLTINSCYDVYVRAICSSGYTEWTNAKRVCTEPDYCAGAHFYDSGGANGNYTDNEDWTKTIYPDNSGDRVKAIFSNFLLESCCDNLTIYNGPNVNSPILFSGSTMYNLPKNFASNHDSGALTFKFHSDGSSVYSGWDAQIICEKMPDCPIPPSDLILQQANLNSLTVKWTDPNASSWEIEVVQDGSQPTGQMQTISTNPFTITGLLRNTAYRVYLRSKCALGNSEMIISNLFSTSADYCGGDHFYDSGGQLSNYSNNEYDTKTIYPTNQGDRVKVIFDMFQLSDSDSFAIYNGPNNNSPLLYSSYNSNQAPGTFESTHVSTGALTFQLYSNSSGNAAGWDARIFCEPMPPCPNLPTNLNVYTNSNTSIGVYWSENSNATQWEVEFVKDGDQQTGHGEIVNNNYFTKYNLLANTCYKVYVRSLCSNGNTDWIVSSLVCTTADYCAGDHFYDNGGVNSNYNGYYSKTIYPVNSGDRVKAIFNMFQIASGDQFIIYNGYYAGSSNILYDSYNNPNPPTTISSTSLESGALTFVLYNYSSVGSQGWDATIICEPMPECSNPPSNILIKSVSQNSIELDWSANTSSKWEVEIVPTGTTPTGSGIITLTKPFVFSNLTPNTCYEVYIRSVCSTSSTNWVKSSSICTITDYCLTGYFYDSGGANGSYSDNEEWVKTIVPIEAGKKVIATFNTFLLETCCDYLEIFNGLNTSSPILFSGSSMTSLPRAFHSSDPSGALTFKFRSDSSVTYEGWESVIDCSKYLSIEYSSKETMKIYPNPVTEGSLNIQSPIQIKHYEIFDTSSRMVLKKDEKLKEIKIDLNTVPSGNYILKVTDKNSEIHIFKIIKK